MSAHILAEMDQASRNRKQGQAYVGTEMNYALSNRAIQRARWLAELSDALAAAERLTVDLGFCGVDWLESHSLAMRLNCLRAETEMMRLTRNDDWPDDRPIWTNLAS